MADLFGESPVAAPIPRRGLPTFWSTAIAKVLIGEQPCFLSAWASGHFEFDKPRNGGTFAKWKAEHTEQLQALVTKHKADGWKCDVERYFKVSGATAVLSGKADLVGQKPECRPLIVDVKSGRPRDSDVAQVIIEMVMIPLAWEAPSMIFDGLVVYPTHNVPVTPMEAAQLKPRIFALLKQLGGADIPPAAPSRDACRFCEVPASLCAERFVDGRTASTEEF